MQDHQQLLMKNSHDTEGKSENNIRDISIIENLTTAMRHMPRDRTIATAWYK